MSRRPHSVVQWYWPEGSCPGPIPSMTTRLAARSVVGIDGRLEARSVTVGASVGGVSVSTVSGVVVATVGGTDVVGASTASVVGGGSVETTGASVVVGVGSVVVGASVESGRRGFRRCRADFLPRSPCVVVQSSPRPRAPPPKPAPPASANGTPATSSGSPSPIPTATSSASPAADGRTTHRAARRHQSLPNHRAIRVLPNSDFWALSSIEGPSRKPNGA